MRDFVFNIVSQIVDLPEEVNVTSSIDEGGQEVINIHVANSDMGKIIGKSGRTIRAIRDLAKIKAIKMGTRVWIQIEEQQEQMDPS